MFKIIRNFCAYRVNDTTKFGYPPEPGKRARYCWVCAKRQCNKSCSEVNCPIVAKIAAQDKGNGAAQRPTGQS